MEFSKVVRKRRSIKRYLETPIEWDKVGSILDAGRMAPSAGNLQPWKFIVVTKPNGKKKIADACLQQYWMESAPVHIVICGEINKMNRFYGVRGERLYSIQSCAAAAENMLLEAVNQNLGGCFISAFDEEMLSRELKIPEFARPQAVLTIGYPGEEVPEPPKYTLNDIVHLETFGAKIRDFISYLGYGSGRNIKNTALKGKDLLNKIADKGSQLIKEKIEKIKINKEESKKQSEYDRKEFKAEEKEDNVNHFYRG